MRIHRLMPVLGCENDMGGRFTKSPISTHNVLLFIFTVFFRVRLDARVGRGRSGDSRVDGSDPLF